MQFSQFLPLCFFLLQSVESICPIKNCPLSLASYYLTSNSNLSFISQLLESPIQNILSYNPSLPDEDRIQSSTRINVPFTCSCINGEFMGRVFRYTVRKGDTYDRIARVYYANLTNGGWISKFSNYPENNIPDNGVVNVTVNCSCGDSRVSKDYGLFLTYPLRPEDSLTGLAQHMNLSVELLQGYNPSVNFSAGSGIVFIPAKDKEGKYPPLASSAGLSGGVIAGISVAVIALLIVLAVLCFVRMRRKKIKNAMLLNKPGSVYESSRLTGSFSAHGGGAAGNTGMTIDKSLEFSYEELAEATSNFSMANKIGSGGFGDVFYAELRGEKAAIKKMDMQASKEFMAELHVLTRVHHLNLVRLIGYCVEQCLFLVYEYVENGNLSQHLRGSEKDALPWSTRVQIALDSARGLEYIHEHTVPVYVHRDIKSANILIDKSFHAKVADFGLTKLTEVGGVASGPTRLVGTFGYMPPEYAQFGDVSPKIDVYAFGVVVYELISAKEAVIRGKVSAADSKGLVGLFEDALNHPDLTEIRKLVDPKLGENYPFDSIVKLAELAKSCTQENPELRPSMRSVVVALMTMSSTTEEWDVGALYKNHGLTR